MALALSGTSNGSLNNLSLSGNTATIVDTGRADSILQAKFGTSSTQVSNATSSYVASSVSVSITPTSSSNYLYVIWQGHFYKNNTGGAFGFNIFQDGTQVTTSYTDGGGPADFLTDVSTRVWTIATKQHYGLAGTTSSTTFDLRFRRYQTNGTVVANGNSDSLGQETMSVWEIKA